MSSTGILNLAITSLPVDNFHDRALWCKSTGINYNMHGWILCRYCATGWFWWISGLRAVTMWSSSSFTKRQPALTHVIRNYVLLLVVPPLCLWWVTHIVTKALRLKILPGQQLPLFPNPPTLLTCHLTGKPGEPCRPALPPAAPSTRDSSTSTSHRGRSDAQKLPTPGRPAGLTSQPNGHTRWW